MRSNKRNAKTLLQHLNIFIEFKKLRAQQLFQCKVEYMVVATNGYLLPAFNPMLNLFYS